MCIGECNRVVRIGNALNNTVGWIADTSTQGMKMPFMALQAEKGLVLLQQIVGNRTMRIMTNGAVFGDRGMLEDERALVAAVAVETQVVGALFCCQSFSAVWVVAIAAGHLAFLDRMMGREVGLGLLLLVTGIAELRVFLLEGRLVAAVDGVAVVAANVAQGVLAVGPVHQLAVGVTLGANRCGFLRQKFTKLEDLVAIRVDMQAAAAMAAFAPFGAAHVLEPGQARVNPCAIAFVTLQTGL